MYAQDYDLRGLAEVCQKHGELSDFSDGLCTGFDNDRGQIYYDKFGKEVYVSQYESGGEAGYGIFSEGLMAVMNDGKHGYIDKSGNIVIPFIYDWTFDFKDGVAKVEKEGKKGIVDKNGKEIIACIYDDVIDFYKGIAIVSKDNKYGMIDKSGNTIFPFQPYSIDKLSEGIAWVNMGNSYEAIDMSGKVVVSPTGYADVRPFSEGLAFVEINNEGAFINTLGETVIKLPQNNGETIMRYSSFMNGIAIGIEKEKLVTIDKEGAKKVIGQYDDFEFYKGGSIIVRKGEKRGLIDKEGKILIPLIYDRISNSGEENLFIVERNGKSGLFDNHGKEVAPIVYSYISFFSEGLVYVSKDGKLGFVDKHGKSTFNP